MPELSLTQAVATGDRPVALRALRDKLARQIDESDSGRDVAALAARLQAVLNDLDNLPNTAEVSAADDLASRRRARRANTTPAADSASS